MTDTQLTQDRAGSLQQAAARFLDNIDKVMVGRRSAAEQILIAFLARGHVLLEDAPGLGKTLLAKTAAASLGVEFKRIQFTPDLMPSDVTGLNYFNQQTGGFQFLPGPVMANLVLADEINRATPRTQSCLLEAMQEGQVSIDAETRTLPRPFLVIATQNPVEQEGTFPLPEAQLDRFMLRVSLGYPDANQEEEILLRFRASDPLDDLQPVLDGPGLEEMGRECRSVHVSEAVRDYLVRLVRATREREDVRLGASPRAGQALFASAQARAAIRGRNHVMPDDVKALAGPVLAHRLILASRARVRGGGGAELVTELLKEIEAPVE